MPGIQSPSHNWKDFIQGALLKTLDNDPGELKAALKALHAVSVRCLEARISAQTELANRTLQYLHPKDKDLTDMDRKIMLDAHIREYRANYELLSGYEKLLEQRINIIEELLK